MVYSTDGLQHRLYAVHLYRVVWELDILPHFFYYELLITVYVKVYY